MVGLNRNFTLFADYNTSTTMPKVGLKVKSKRTAARSPFENKTTDVRLEDSDIEMGDETSSDEEDVPEKDEAEKKLERMLFGDDEGFMGALKKQQDREAGMALTLNSDDSDVDEDSKNEPEDLDDMADSDVRDPTVVLIPISNLTYFVFYSSSFSIQAHPPLVISLHRRKLHRMLRMTRRTLKLQCGTTAMMTVLPYR